MAYLYNTLLEAAMDFSSATDPLSAYPGAKFTNIANDDLKAAGGVCNGDYTASRVALYTYNTATTPPANSGVQAAIVCEAGDHSSTPMIIGRYVNSTTFYIARYYRITGRLELYRLTTAGGAVLLGTYTTATASGTLRMEFEDEAGTGHTTIDVYLNGTVRIIAHDETPIGYNTALKHGIRYLLETSAGSTIDDLAVYYNPWSGNGFYGADLIGALTPIGTGAGSITAGPQGGATLDTTHRTRTADIEGAVMAAGDELGVLATIASYPVTPADAEELMVTATARVRPGA